MLTRPARPARDLLAGMLALLVLGLLAGLTAAPASAHARFVSSDPAEGSELAALPGSVVMTYSEEISPQFVDTAVVPPGGEPVATPASVAGTDVTIDLSEVAPEGGSWQVVARVVSADGHPVEHTVTLVVAEPSEPTAEPTAEPSEPTEQTTEQTTAEPETTAAPIAEPEAPGATGTPGATEEPSTTATPLDADPLDAGGGLPRWLLVLLAVAVAGAAGVAVVLKLRGGPPEDRRSP